MHSAGVAWFDSEIAGCDLADERLKTRLGKLLAQLGGDSSDGNRFCFCRWYAHPPGCLVNDHSLDRCRFVPAQLGPQDQRDDAENEQD